MNVKIKKLFVLSVLVALIYIAYILMVTRDANISSISYQLPDRVWSAHPQHKISKGPSPAGQPLIQPAGQSYNSAIEELNAYIYSRSQPSAKDEDLFIEDIFIGLKSTRGYHSTRIKLLLDTWIPQARDSVHLMTDADDEEYSRIFGSLYINTGCESGHSREHMMCKIQSMYNTFMKEKTRYKWLCSVDDDEYMNIPNLVKLLRRYNYEEDWFLGKPSLTHQAKLKQSPTMKVVEFWFPTGGATICLSKSLTERMAPLCEGNKFLERGKEINAPDDTTLGYVCNYLLNVTLTVIPEFHSHLEAMWVLHPAKFHNQISISWGTAKTATNRAVPNVVLIRREVPQYPLSSDPTRALTLHCYLFPNSEQCKKIQEAHGPMKLYLT